jgi:hypothetical protein
MSLLQKEYFLTIVVDCNASGGKEVWKGIINVSITSGDSVPANDMRVSNEAMFLTASRTAN